MAKNVKLGTTATPDDDERELGDGVFPYVFGKLDGPTATPDKVDLARDVEALGEEGATPAKERAIQFRDVLTWYQAIGTPCGYYLLQSLLAQSKLLQSCCLRLATHHPEFTLQVPLFPWLRENLREWTAQVKAGAPEAAPLEVLVKSLRTWLNLDKAVGVISGESPLSFRSARNALVLLDKWLGGTEELALSLPQGGDPEEPACPLEAGLPLGTNAMAHAAGHAASSLYFSRLHRAAAVEFDPAPYVKGSSFELYPLALYDKSLVAKLPEDESKLLTYLAAHDLAQFTPLHPLFAHLREGLRWNDLHPGHRLERALTLVKDKELRLEEVSSQAYFEFTSTICEELGWPEVPRFLDATTSADELEVDAPIPQMFKIACDSRQEHPEAFIDPFAGAEQLAELAPPGTQLADVETSRDTDLALSFALEAELYATGFQLFFGEAEPTLLCPDFKETVALLHDEPEMLQTYFGLEF